MKELKNLILLISIAVALLVQSCDGGKPSRNAIMAADTTYSDVVREWSKMIDKYPQNHEYLHSRSLDLMSDGKYSDALLDINEALALNPSVSYLLTKADILMELNESKKVLTTLREAVELDPINDEALFRLGKFYLYVRKFKEAKQFLGEAINQNKSNIDAYFYMGMVNKEDGDSALALEYFKRVVEIDALNSQALHQIADIYLAKTDPEGIEYLNRLIFNNDLDHAAYYSRGLMYQNLGYLEKALKDYQKTIDIHATHYLAYYNAGYILFQQKKWERAIEHFRIAIKFAPELAKGYYMLGLSNEGLNQTEQAVKFYDLTLQVDPDFTKAKQRLQELK